MKSIIRHGRELLNRGEDFVLAKVIETTGSAPRKYGAWLLMERDGSVLGTVGGGKVEAEVELAARETFKHKESRLYHYELTAEDQGGIDMRCGGNVQVSIEYIDHTKPESFEMEGQRTSLVYVLGAGHVAKALVPILHSVEFDTVVIDDRSEFANAERFPKSELLVTADFPAFFAGTQWNQDTYIVIVTRGHNYDLEVLREAIKQKVAYIGMIGSKQKVAHIYQSLEQEGISKELLSEVYSPIGLKIGAETPEEIAISIVAEMIQVRSKLWGTK